MFIYVNGYSGLMSPSFWDELKDTFKYFDDVKKYRKKLLKKESMEELIVEDKLTIDEVLNKINNTGLESLTENEKSILQNHNDKK